MNIDTCIYKVTRHPRLLAAALLLLGALLPESAAAQHHIGLRGGYGGGMARFDPKVSGRETRLLLDGGPSFGVSWKYYSPELGVGGLQADLQYVTKGYRELYDQYTDGESVLYRSEYRRVVQAVELPFFWQFYFYAFDRRVRGYLNAGAFASYLLGSQESGVAPYLQNPSEADKMAFGADPVWRDYELRSVRDNRFGFGLAGGVGVSVLFRRFEVFAEGRYAVGFSNLLKSQSKYPEHVNIQRSQLDMVNVSVGIYYRLGKDGILAPPAGTNRPTESWDSLPVGRNREAAGASGGTNNNTPPAGGGQRNMIP